MFKNEKYSRNLRLLSKLKYSSNYNSLSDTSTRDGHYCTRFFYIVVGSLSGYIISTNSKDDLPNDGRSIIDAVLGTRDTRTICDSSVTQQKQAKALEMVFTKCYWKFMYLEEANGAKLISSMCNEMK